MRHCPERSNFSCKIIVVNKAFRKGDQAFVLFKVLILSYISSRKARNLREPKLLPPFPNFTKL